MAREATAQRHERLLERLMSIESALNDFFQCNFVSLLAFLVCCVFVYCALWALKRPSQPPACNLCAQYVLGVAHIRTPTTGNSFACQCVCMTLTVFIFTACHLSSALSVVYAVVARIKAAVRWPRVLISLQGLLTFGSHFSSLLYNILLYGSLSFFPPQSILCIVFLQQILKLNSNF